MNKQKMSKIKFLKNSFTVEINYDYIEEKKKAVIKFSFC